MLIFIARPLRFFHSPPGLSSNDQSYPDRSTLQKLPSWRQMLTIAASGNTRGAHCPAYIRELKSHADSSSACRFWGLTIARLRVLTNYIFSCLSGAMELVFWGNIAVSTLVLQLQALGLGLTWLAPGLSLGALVYPGSDPDQCDTEAWPQYLPGTPHTDLI